MDSREFFYRYQFVDTEGEVSPRMTRSADILQGILIDISCELLQFFLAHYSHNDTSSYFGTVCSIITLELVFVNIFTKLFVLFWENFYFYCKLYSVP